MQNSARATAGLATAIVLVALAAHSIRSPLQRTIQTQPPAAEKRLPSSDDYMARVAQEQAKAEAKLVEDEAEDRRRAEQAAERQRQWDAYMAAPPTWRNALRVTKSSPSKLSANTVKWTVTVSNSSASATFKDVHFKTTYTAASGTEIDRSIVGHTEYQLFPPNRSVTFSFTELVHSQATNGEVEIDDAVTVTE